MNPNMLSLMLRGLSRQSRKQPRLPKGHYYSIAINYRKNDLEQKMLLNLGKKKWQEKPLQG